jgi:quinoprotein dehydrogenase-associated probable ABC transporter substrate-binding protein
MTTAQLRGSWAETSDRTYMALRVLRFAAAFGVTFALATAAGPDREFRVCADPDNLPFSNDRLEGFENKIAQVVADDLHASVRYTWFLQRDQGFIRQTLNAGKCDVVIGVPSGWNPVLTTRPYYASSYVFVYLKNKYRNLRSFDEPLLRQLRIGLQVIGEDRSNLPPDYALARRGLARNIVAFSIFPSLDTPAGQIIGAVAAGEIDVAVVWGPFAGYFAKRQTSRLVVMPVSGSADSPSPRFTYEVSMGVRRRDTEFKEQLEGVLDRRRKHIIKILENYSVPLVPSTDGSLASARSLH